MEMHFRHNAHPVALLPSLDQSDAQAQLWSDDKHFAVVKVPAGTLVAQASLAVDLSYEHYRKATEQQEHTPVVSIDKLQPARLTAEQVKDYHDTGALTYADIRYVWCSRSPRGGDTDGMTVKSVSTEDGRIGVLFTLKRGLPGGDWQPIEATLSEPDKEAVKKYGERHWLLTWGVTGGIIVLTIVLTWAYYTLQRH